MWGGHDDNTQWIMSVCLRVGLLLAAIWLALPQLAQLAQRMPPWLAGGTLLVGLLVAIRPRLIVYVAPLLAAMAVLQFWGWLFKPLPGAKHRSKTDSD